MNLQSFTLQIFKPELALDFYIRILGFSLLREFSEGDITHYDLGFDNPNFFVRLRCDPSIKEEQYQEQAKDNYWKYSLFVDDIQQVHRELQAQRVSVGEPFQFGNIGYLAHTADSENHKIEYIQKTFKQNGSVGSTEETALGLLTIRTKDPIKAISMYESVLGMKLFVRMHVDRGNGFTLYFLGDKNLQAPNPDIDAIENREWMYQQSHLFIEIQHYWGSEQDAEFQLNSTENKGLQSINFIGNLKDLKAGLDAHNIVFKEDSGRISFKTRDHHTILVEQA